MKKFLFIARCANISRNVERKYCIESRNFWWTSNWSYVSFSVGELYERLPEGLNTIVSEKGMNFSGGEKQRIAFTRLAFTQAEILILDEATSALDEKTEEKVLQEVQNLPTISWLFWLLIDLKLCDL